MSTTIRSDGVEHGCFVEVADLVAAAITGGALVGIVADAKMFGDSTAWAITSTSSTTLPSGESIVKGMGTVVEIGDNPAVNVQVFSVGGLPLEPGQLNFFRQRYAALLNYYMHLPRNLL